MPACRDERWRSSLDTNDGSFRAKYELQSMAKRSQGKLPFVLVEEFLQTYKVVI